MPRACALFIAMLALAGESRADLLVTSFANDSVLRYDSSTGAFLGVFTSGGGLQGPKGIAVRPNGNVLVASSATDNILQYDASGNFLGAFASGGGLNSPFEIELGTNGDLYVASNLSNDILRYSGTTGAFLNVFSVDADPLQPNQPRGLEIANGFLFTSVEGDRIRRYNFSTGAFVSAPVGDNPRGLTLGPDGFLYVGYNSPANVVWRHDGTTGAGISEFVSSGSGGLAGPMGLLFGPDGNCMSRAAVRIAFCVTTGRRARI